MNIFVEQAKPDGDAWLVVTLANGAQARIDDPWVTADGWLLGNDGSGTPVALNGASVTAMRWEVLR